MYYGIEGLDLDDELEAESLQHERFSELNSIADRIQENCGVCKTDAVSLEGFCEGLVNDMYPLASYTQVPSRTNYNVSMEFIDTNNKLLMGGVIAAGLAILAKILHWIWKFFSGEGGSDAAGAGGGASGSASKLEAENAETAKGMSPTDVKKAEDAAIASAEDGFKFTVLMNHLHVTGGRETTLIADVASCFEGSANIVGVLKDTKAFLSTQTKPGILKEPRYTDAAEQLQYRQELKETIEKMYLSSKHAMGIASHLVKYTEPRYDPEGEGNTYAEFGKHVVANLRKMSEEKGTGIAVDGLAKGFKGFRWELLDTNAMLKGENVNGLIESLTEEVKSADKLFEGQIEKLESDEYKTFGKDYARVSINKTKDMLVFVASICQAHLIISREMVSLSKLSEKFQKDFKDQLKKIKNSSDHMEVAGKHTGA